LISSPTTTLAKTAPGRNSKVRASWLNTLTPVTSLGRRSGVNWMRWTVQSMLRPRALASIVLPTPGTSSTRRCPWARSTVITVRTTSFLPSMTPAMASSMRAATPWTSSSSFTPRSSPKKRRGGGVWPRGLASPPREEVQPDRPLDGEHLVDRAGGGLLDRLAEQRDRRGDVAGEGLLGALAGGPQGHPPGHPDGGAGDVEGQGPRAAAVGLRGLPRLDEPDVQALPD